MAEYTKIELDSSEPTGPLSPEEQSASPTGTASGGKSSPTPPTPPPTSPDPAGDRPAWLPEKFKSPEDLAKAYASLESKLGAKPEPAKDLKITEQVKKDALDFSSYQQEFLEKGELSPESYAKLEGAGLSRNIVEMYIEGVRAQSERQAAKAFEAAGGQEQYQAVVEWARSALSPEEITAYNQAVSSGNEAQMLFALKGLVGRYRYEAGTEPTLVAGRAGPAGPAGFRSVGEMKAAMRDPRYDTDEAYRADVAQRIARSNF